MQNFVLERSQPWYSILNATPYTGRKKRETTMKHTEMTHVSGIIVHYRKRSAHKSVKNYIICFKKCDVLYKFSKSIVTTISHACLVYNQCNMLKNSHQHQQKAWYCRKQLHPFKWKFRMG